jgi:hypothetical protein
MLSGAFAWSTRSGVAADRLVDVGRADADVATSAASASTNTAIK